MNLHATVLSIAVVVILAASATQALEDWQGSSSQHHAMAKRSRRLNEDTHGRTAGRLIDRDNESDVSNIVERDESEISNFDERDNEGMNELVERNEDLEERDSKSKDCDKASEKHPNHKKNHAHHRAHSQYKHHSYHHHHRHHHHPNATHHSHHHVHHHHKSSQHDDTSHKESSHQATHSHSSGGGGGGGGLQGRVYDCSCPHPNASEEYPNGDISFLNCNIKSGWNPPPVKIDHLKIASADEVVNGKVFSPCKKYLSEFKQVANQYGVHPTILMAFAMQESHCDGTLLGPNGEIGMMQVIPELCRGDCWNVYNNIGLGAKEFVETLKQHNGNALYAFGSYNGWETGMTVGKVRSMPYGCSAQQNLDYLNQMLNAWLQGKDGYAKKFCKYDNLAHC